MLASASSSGRHNKLESIRKNPPSSLGRPLCPDLVGAHDMRQAFVTQTKTGSLSRRRARYRNRNLWDQETKPSAAKLTLLVSYLFRHKGTRLSPSHLACSRERQHTGGGRQLPIPSFCQVCVQRDLPMKTSSSAILSGISLGVSQSCRGCSALCQGKSCPGQDHGQA